MTRIQSYSLHSRVADIIRDMIQKGSLEAGEKISEKQLCNDLGVSRTPLREALKTLASEGLIELIPNRGARVVNLTQEMLRDTFAVMSALEGLSGELACQHITTSEIAVIIELHNRMVAHYENNDIKGYFATNREIHEKIVESSKNQPLIQTYQGLSQRIKAIRYNLPLSPQEWRKAIRDHEAIIQYLDERNGFMLGVTLREHLRNKIKPAP